MTRDVWARPLEIGRPRVNEGRDPPFLVGRGFRGTVQLSRAKSNGRAPMRVHPVHDAAPEGLEQGGVRPDFWSVRARAYDLV